MPVGRRLDQFFADREKFIAEKKAAYEQRVSEAAEKLISMIIQTAISEGYSTSVSFGLDTVNELMEGDHQGVCDMLNELVSLDDRISYIAGDRVYTFYLVK